MRALVLTLLVVISMPRVGHSDAWTPTDTAAQAAVLLTLGADYLQTREIVACGRDPACGQRESNPIMGHGGERVPPAVYFATIAVAHTAAARVLPQPWRRLSQIALVAVQAYVVHHNWEAGYAVSF